MNGSIITAIVTGTMIYGALQAPAESSRSPKPILIKEGSSEIAEPYPLLSGGVFEKPVTKESPDPLVHYHWKEPKATDGLQIYFLKPTAAVADKAESFGNLESLSATIGIDGKREYQIALYFVDWERKGNNLVVEMFDANTLNLISPVKLVENFSGGELIVPRHPHYLTRFKN